MDWLTARTDDALSPKACADPLWWREAFLLAVIAQKTKPRFAVSFIHDMLDFNDNLPAKTRLRLIILAGLALNELGMAGTETLTQRIRQELTTLLQDGAELNVEERAEAGRVLCYIGDFRKGVGLNEQNWPDIDWVEIPAGAVVLADDAGTFTVEPCCLARFPVTNAQFQRFIEDPEGYANPRWWEGLDATPGMPATPAWSEANHPRETVSWFEAMAFCIWLTDRLSYPISLPTEWQWQQAACSGEPDFYYPWEKEYRSGHANIDETWSDAGPHNLGITKVGIPEILLPPAFFGMATVLKGGGK